MKYLKLLVIALALYTTQAQPVTLTFKKTDPKNTDQLYLTFYSGNMPNINEISLNGNSIEVPNKIQIQKFCEPYPKCQMVYPDRFIIYTKGNRKESKFIDIPHSDTTYKLNINGNTITVE